MPVLLLLFTLFLVANIASLDQKPLETTKVVPEKKVLRNALQRAGGSPPRPPPLQSRSDNTETDDALFGDDEIPVVHGQRQEGQAIPKKDGWLPLVPAASTDDQEETLAAPQGHALMDDEDDEVPIVHAKLERKDAPNVNDVALFGSGDQPIADKEEDKKDAALQIHVATDDEDQGPRASRADDDDHAEQVVVQKVNQ